MSDDRISVIGLYGMQLGIMQAGVIYGMDKEAALERVEQAKATMRNSGKFTKAEVEALVDLAIIAKQEILNTPTPPKPTLADLLGLPHA